MRIARRDQGLSAAALTDGKGDLAAVALEDLHGRPRHPRKQLVDVAGHEESDAHGDPAVEEPAGLV